MKPLLIALMFIGFLFAQQEVKAFVIHHSQTGNFDENAMMVPANEKMNKLGKTPKSLKEIKNMSKYATSLKKLYEEGWEIKDIFYDSTEKGGSAVIGAVGASKVRTVFIMVR